MQHSLTAGFLVLAIAAAPVAAQQPTTATPPGKAAPGTRSEQTVARADSQPAVRDSLGISVSPELRRSIEELAVTLESVGHRVANDPELRASAVRAAQSFVAVAQVMIVQNADLLQDVLRRAAERLAEVAPPTR